MKVNEGLWVSDSLDTVKGGFLNVLTLYRLNHGIIMKLKGRLIINADDAHSFQTPVPVL